MSLFSFNLDFFQTTETRSLHEDTDYVSFTLAVNGVSTTLVKSMGDLNNGVHTVNLSFNNISVNPSDSVVLNYLILNAGQVLRVDVEEAMESAAAKLLVDGPGLNLPQLSSSLKVLADWLTTNLPFVNPPGSGCDGCVAAEQDTFTGTDLAARTANGRFSQSTTHPGISSRIGCGGNSVYIVNWHMIDLSVSSIAVPGVFEFSQADAKTAVEAAGLVALFETPASKPTAQATQVTNPPWVFSQSPVAGTLVVAGSTVTMVLHTGIKP
jgi:hypothetical protein